MLGRYVLTITVRFRKATHRIRYRILITFRNPWAGAAIRGVEIFSVGDPVAFNFQSGSRFNVQHPTLNIQRSNSDREPNAKSQSGIPSESPWSIAARRRGRWRKPVRKLCRQLHRSSDRRNGLCQSLRIGLQGCAAPYLRGRYPECPCRGLHISCHFAAFVAGCEVSRA